MGITAEWDNPEKTVILFTNAGNQTWEEFFAGVKKVNEMINSVDHKVDLIIDGRELKSIPPSAMTHFRNALNTLPPTTRVIGVVNNPFVRAIGNVMQKISKTKMISVSTLEEARAIAYGDAKQS